MNRRHSKKLFNDFPEMFRGRNQGVQKNLMAFGFMCGDGWYHLLYTLCSEIKKHLDNYPDDRLKDFIILEVKEKFGTLRFYVNGCDDHILKLIRKAEQESEVTCEICGNSGRMCVKSGWYQTLCSSCRRKKGFQVLKV